MLSKCFFIINATTKISQYMSEYFECLFPKNVVKKYTYLLSCLVLKFIFEKIFM